VPREKISEPANLTVHVSALRRTLRDGRDGNRFIINIPGRGYCFVTPISSARSSALCTLPALEDLAPVWRSLLAATSDVTHIMFIRGLGNDHHDLLELEDEPESRE
jgi:DNA-binding winged helix-turn-helix (wHTH) protein